MPNLLEEFHDVSRKLLLPQTLGSTFFSIVSLGMKLSGADHGTIFLRKGHYFRRVYGSGIHRFIVNPRPRGCAFETFKSGQLKVLKRSDILNIHPEIKKSPVKLLIMVPLSDKKLREGVLILHYFKNSHLSDNKLKKLRLFGNLVSLTLHKNLLLSERQLALKTRDTFISFASHELKTPLTTLGGYLQLLKCKLNRRQKALLSLVSEGEKSLQRLTRTIDVFLQAEQIQKGQMCFFWQKCSIREVIRQAIADFHICFAKREILFKDKADKKYDVIIADPDKLLESVNNILHNAVKFSSSRLPIEISMTHVADRFIISITDHGKGISSQDLPKIFDRFYQGNNSLKKGLGLGLYLTKEIITNHNGELNVYSKLRRGTTFEIILPEKAVAESNI